MNKIAYLMHVHWGWIKQRPHYLAEFLSAREGFSIEVFFEAIYKRSLLISNAFPSVLKLKTLFVFPFRRFVCIRSLNIYLISLQLKKSIKESKIIWITHPFLFDWVRNLNIKDKYIIYDCMDDELEAPNIGSNLILKTKLRNVERALIERANLLLTSSENLKAKLEKRYEIPTSRINVINNAINSEHKTAIAKEYSSNFLQLKKSMQEIKQRKLLYTGTIGSWLDFNLLLKTISLFDDICFVFVGPVQCKIPVHERILHFSQVPHHEIFEAMQLADALIMPFIVDDFIRGVDPVKVYEYIKSGKPCAVVGYEETRKFLPFVRIYNDENEFFAIIKEFIAREFRTYFSEDSAESFLSLNNWEARVDSVIKLISTDYTGNSHS